MDFHYMEEEPKVHPDAYVHPQATLIGAVTIAEGVSVWPSAVIRGDLQPIEIGAQSNVQDNATVHVGYAEPVKVGKRVTVGHNAVLHGCTIGDDTLIGMGSIVLNNAVIGKGCIVGAGAVVPQGMQVPDHSLVLGVPAKVVKTLSDAAVAENVDIALGYWELSKRYRAQK